jgi:hypothetical protein
MEVEGEDPECSLHGLSIRKIAEWSDLDCEMDPEWESWTIRRVAQVTLRRLERVQALIETARENGNFDDYSVAAEDLIVTALEAVCRDAKPLAIATAAGTAGTENTGPVHEGAGLLQASPITGPDTPQGGE